MIENRRAWLDLLMGPTIEGGFVDDADDTGGATNHGITAAVLGDWDKLNRVATADEVRAVTIEKAEAIALSRYWNRMKCDALPAGIDIYAADFCFNSGSHAARLLQQLVSTKVDTFVGDQTISAVRAVDPSKLLLLYHNTRLAWLEGLASWPKYGTGWRSRCTQMYNIASAKTEKTPWLNQIAKSGTIQAASGAAAIAAFPWQDIVSSIINNVPAIQTGYSQIVEAQSTQDIGGHVKSAIIVVLALVACFNHFKGYLHGHTIK